MNAPFRIGLISDTHKLLRPQATRLLATAELIIHAGDIGSMDVIAGLEKIAPVRAIRGNVDRGAWAAAFPTEDLIEIGDKRIYVLHDLNDLTFDAGAAGFDAVVSGHSHKPSITEVDGVLFVNPGSAGPRRFTLPVAVAMLGVTPAGLAGQIHELRV